MKAYRIIKRKEKWIEEEYDPNGNGPGCRASKLVYDQCGTLTLECCPFGAIHLFPHLPVVMDSEDCRKCACHMHHNEEQHSVTCSNSHSKYEPRRLPGLTSD